MPRSPPDAVGKPACLYLPAHGTYYDITFASWTAGGGGGFSYERKLANALCAANSMCVNQPGSFVCACKVGFELDATSGKCVDVDACVKNPCGANATCTDKVGNVNTPDGRTCACNKGFTGNGTTCSDIDECAATVSPCPAASHCENTPGNFQCTHTCADILAANPSATSGVYSATFFPIDATPTDIYCDMDFAGGGWTLIARGGMTTTMAEVVPTPQTTGYMPSNRMQALAGRSHELAFRDETPVNFVRTLYDGKTDTTPIVNLRQGFSPYRTPGEYNAAIWVGGGVGAKPNDRLWFGCAGPIGDYVYPKILYWACDNSGGLHWLTNGATWSFSGGGTAVFELWFR